MLENEFVEQTYPIECKGRNEAGNEVLSNPVEAQVKICRASKTEIVSSVKCQYNTGGHGHRCKASHPGLIKLATV